MPDDTQSRPAGLVVSHAEREDVAALVPFARQAFLDAYRLIVDPADLEDYVTRHYTHEAFLSILEDERATLLVATVDRRLIGYAQLARTPPPPCITGRKPMELVRIYLGEECKGRGYGTKLMREVFAEARRQQCETVWLGVDERNVRAREFYERWRFRDVGKKAFPVGGRICTDVLMSAEVRDDA